MKALKRVEGVWFLITRRGESCRVRRIDRDAKPLTGEGATTILGSLDQQWDARELWMPGDPTRSPASKIPFDRLADWRAIAAELDRAPQSYVLPNRPSAPNTLLRDLCEVLRTVPKGVHKALAVTWLSDPTFLTRRFLESVSAFEDYVNDEPFVPALRSGQSLRETSRFAREVVRLTHETSNLRVGDMVFQYLGYEVSPRRTTGAVLDPDDDRNPSGLGGIDLVVTDGRALGIVEIKASTDTTLLIALVQTLMYAAELVPIDQRHRLAQYGVDTDTSLRSRLSFLAANANTPFIDLIVLFEAKSDQANEVESVVQLAQVLLSGAHADAEAMCQYIRRILFVAGTMGEDNGLQCQLVRQVDGTLRQSQ